MATKKRKIKKKRTVRKKRSPGQKKAIKKLVAFNKKRRKKKRKTVKRKVKRKVNKGYIIAVKLDTGRVGFFNIAAGQDYIESDKRLSMKFKILSGAKTTANRLIKVPRINAVGVFDYSDSTAAIKAEFKKKIIQ